MPHGSEWVNITIKRDVYEELRRRASGRSISDYLAEVLHSQVNREPPPSDGCLQPEAGAINSQVNGLTKLENVVCRHRGSGVSYCVEYSSLSKAVEAVDKEGLDPFKLERKCQHGRCNEDESLVYEAFNKGLVVYSPMSGWRVLE